jgi:hypothetical protein
MIDQSGPSKQICLLNAIAQCDRIWVSQLDGLRLSHFQTLAKEQSIRTEGGLAIGVGPARLGDTLAYEQCVRGCIGPG